MINLSASLQYLSFITDSTIDQSASIGKFSRIHSCIVGPYTYCSNSCNLINVNISSYSSIGPGVTVVAGLHPTTYPAMSPIFHGRPLSGAPHNTSFNLFPDPNSSASICSFNAPTTLGPDIWIGAGVTLFSGVKIGTGAVIGTNSLVTTDIPPYAIAWGTPARIQKYRFNDQMISDLLHSEWWTYRAEDAAILLAQLSQSA